jgi:hypothetical protein
VQLDILVGVELSQRVAVIVRALLYLVQYERDPLDKVDRALAVVHAAGLPDELRAAIDQALASSVALANLGPEYHPEVIVRRYLAEVRRRLSSQPN